MSDLTLTQTQARRFILAHQGLWPPRALWGKAGVLEYLHRVRCLQFDPLNIVGRNPELVLQARMADFRPTILDELLYQDRLLVDGWDKMMSIYPIQDWPCFHRRRQEARAYRGRSRDQVDAIAPLVRGAVEQRGPLSSIDLDFAQRVDWPWGETHVGRAALESLWDWGELIIHHKVNTRKVYDLACRHIPAAILNAPDPHETPEAYHEWYVLRRLGSVGLVRAGGGAAGAWLGLPGIASPERIAIIEQLLQRGDLLQLDVEGLPYPCHMRSQDRATLDRVLQKDEPPAGAAIIAPLDNLIWDRQFIQTLFDFSYTWEVYKPQAQREYGYYVLPVLYGDRFVARWEPGREKKNGALTIANWWWEEGITPDANMRRALSECFARFLAYLGRDTLLIADDAIAQAHLGWLSPI